VTIAVENDAKRKWDGAAGSFDLLSFGDDRRFAAYKRRLFAKMHGKSLMVATGTGNDFKYFPPRTSSRWISARKCWKRPRPAPSVIPAR